MRLLSSTTMLAAAGFALFTAGSVATAPSAQAQGRTTGTLELPRERGLCPYGWKRPFEGGSKKADYCEPFGAVNPTPSVYVRQNKSVACNQGYFVDTDNDLVCTSVDLLTTRNADRPDGIARAGILNRCPTGWQASVNNKQCFTEIENAPVPHLKNGKPCAPGELDDWGIWCTSNYQHLSYAEVDLAGLRDFNTIYANAMNYSLDYNSIPATTLSPDAKAFFKGANASPAASAAEPSSASQPAENKAAECTSASEVGAAVGGALGGRKGAAIGGALGGLGKKKKKGC
ncbi:MAG: hypothetical protein HC843_11705 [Sphingomonadales bacterium]|nr:hypothetical protein [Sphingomonadales bacterium]